MNRLSDPHRQLAIVMFGLLHQLVFYAALTNAQSFDLEQLLIDNSTPNIPLITLAEGVVKSVAGSLFHSCTSSLVLIDQTTQVCY